MTTRLICKEPKNNRWERVKGITNKFATSTSVYGINRMVKAKSIPMRIVWTLMALASVSLGFIIIGNTIVNFFKFDVFTQTKLLNPEPNSSFMPSVTFCTESDDNPNNLIIEANFIDKLGTERSVNLSGVSFYDQNLDSYYRCLRFNHYQENKTGYHKLFPIKYINSQHFTFKINLTANFTDVSILMSDNYIQILDWSQLVTTFGNDQRGYIDIGFTKKIDRKLGEPYNKCQVTLESTYRQVNCIAKCRNRDFGRKYNCTLRNFYGDSSYDFCQNGIYFSAEFDADCEKECPKECITTEFDVITNYYVSTASANDSLHIEVSYLDLRFLEISQTPKMSEYSLINEIGGALSLFVGVTFLSLLEFLEYFFEVCLVLYRC